MEPEARIELTTCCLRNSYSTTELLWHEKQLLPACRQAGTIEPPRLERVAGIEPAAFAWEANILPLYYTRLYLFIKNQKNIPTISNNYPFLDHY